MFYDKFKALCDLKGISCSKAAEEIGLNNATPTWWKKRGLTPSGETLTRIAEYFGVSTDYLLHGVSGYQPQFQNETDAETDETFEQLKAVCAMIHGSGNEGSSAVVSAKVMQVIVVETQEGSGTENDPRRKQKQYWSLEGELLATK